MPTKFPSENTIKTRVTEIGCECWLGATGSGHGPNMGFCKSCNKPFDCRKIWNFLNCWL